MFQGWTFGQKVGAGFATVVLLTLLISVIAVYALRTVVENKDKVIDVNARNLADTRQLEALNGEVSSLSRGYYLAKEDRRLAEIEEVRAQKRALLNRLKANLGSEEQGALAQVESADAELQKAVDATIALKKADKPLEDIVTAFNEEVSVKRRRLSQLLEDLESREAARLEEAKKAASALAADSTNLVVGIAATGLLLAVGLAYFLTTTLTRQIGSAVQHVQSSSGELQAAASQQASGAKEQATAMNEITTTISELMATSRQIAQSSQRVAQIAGQTAEGARSGNLTVQRAQESVSGIRRQVDLIVNHMLDLGRKSQQIGGILEIINELAEQTNILSINASIEAAGAGEAGKRFGVVADEIRKLADRVAGSTKEIRTLIEEIRAAVNTTVMATEGGSKAVDAGLAQFNEVAASFKRIGDQVGTTTEAAQEIELSTKQQSTAVEQVNLAISNAAQATKEMEASAVQTLQTAGQLTSLARDLTRLIQASA